ncbi:class A beta-lactamase [Amycolatopsis endophytica]|uniref:Beta-lactamase n=1 Tax=Amycolatopsis endophytica TaxID=860233 RepID=A0A853BCW6_9PSEU|nr:class A beta-lactamase [Amycolatopsis endophytica]NYI93213.1 beta-lactamase class A [Amycolatopsis endophytica]
MLVRTLSTLTAALAFGLVTACATETVPPPPATSAASPAPVQVDFGDLEKQFDARLGVYAIDTGTGREITSRADERFAYCSTIKVPLAGSLLRRGADLNEVLRYTSADVVANSPTTKDRTSVTVREAVEAALTQSDNTAANLMYRELGGPATVGDVLREIGDTTTHVDRTETDLNSAVPGDIRDTSTPRALATTLRAFVLGDALPADERDLLTGIMRRNTTGAETIRAGVPSDWTVADKTGSGSYGTRNDIGVLWPPSGAPIVIAVLTSRATEDAAYQNALLAQATARVVEALR